MRTKRRRKNLTHGALPARLDALAAEGRLPALLKELPDERERLLLLLRHGLGLSWPAIQEEVEKRQLYYCERHLYRLYAQALGRIAALRGLYDEG